MGRVRNAKTRTTKNKSYKKSHDTKRRARDVILHNRHQQTSISSHVILTYMLIDRSNPR